VRDRLTLAQPPGKAETSGGVQSILRGAETQDRVKRELALTSRIDRCGPIS
jgi:hypothetical protein